MPKALKIALPLVVVLVAAGVAGWWFLIRDDAPPAVRGVAEQFGQGAGTTTAEAASAAAPATTAVTGAAATNATPATTAAAIATTADGTWSVRPADNVFAGYRINEEFAAGVASSTAVGRSPGVSGTMTVAGRTVTAARVEVDLNRLASDSAQRDSRLRDGGLEIDRFPTATFVLMTPIDLGAEPQTGQVFTATAAGDLTLHGVTLGVQLPLEARWTGATVDVTGSMGIVLADYGISMEAFAGFVRVADEGTIELALQFAR